MENKISEVINGLEYSYFNSTRSKALELALKQEELESFVGRLLLQGKESAKSLYGAVTSAMLNCRIYEEYDENDGEENYLIILDYLWLHHNPNKEF